MSVGKLADQLISNMEQEAGYYRRLLACLEEEARHLKSFSTPGLAQSAQKKEMILQQIRQSREESIEAFNKLVKALRLDLPPLSITELVRHLPEAKIGMSLKLLKNQLNYFHEEVMMKMNLNANFISECINCWNSIINVLHPEYLVNYDGKSAVKKRSFTPRGVSVNREI